MRRLLQLAMLVAPALLAAQSARAPREPDVRTWRYTGDLRIATPARGCLQRAAARLVDVDATTLVLLVDEADASLGAPAPGRHPVRGRPVIAVPLDSTCNVLARRVARRGRWTTIEEHALAGTFVGLLASALWCPNGRYDPIEQFPFSCSTLQTGDSRLYGLILGGAALGVLSGVLDSNEDESWEVLPNEPPALAESLARILQRPPPSAAPPRP
ncbi:MAG: hypothetical protein HY275_01135 [Gemmatimonadetes bacterium]|nr:hypothetical protein [Gemmatimonadota bacterium]